MGVGIVALMAAVLALAVDPGWALALSTLGAFILLDIVLGQFVEPHLYGHATGLSPLSVVVAAIFWSWLWGPAGLILSTLLTLCLLVVGRHMKGFGVLELLLGNSQPLTLPQRFYQRALSADPHEIIANARTFLKNDSLAAYCDRVMIPALHLARLDADAGATTGDQQLKIRRVITNVAAALSGNSLKRLHRHRGAVLEEVNPGRWLRQKREQLTGKWQGPLGVPQGSIVICMALGSPADELATELLVRLLCGEKIDGRHFSPADIDAGLPPAPIPTASPSFSWSVPSRARNASAQTRSAGGFMICCRKRTSSGCCVPERVGYPNPPIKTLPNLRQALSVRPSKFLSPGRRRAATRAFSQWIHELRGVRVDGQVDGQWQIVGSCDQDNREPKIYCACRANPHAAPNWLMRNSAAELRAQGTASDVTRFLVS